MDTARLRAAEGPLAPYEAGLLADFVGRNYVARSVKPHLLLMRRLSHWLDQGGLDPAALGPEQIAEFLGWNRAAGYKFPKAAQGAEPMLGFLRRLAVVPMPRPPVLSPTEELLQRFALYLAHERGLTTATVSNHVRAGRVFMQALERAGEVDLEALSTFDVNRFVVAECPGRSTAAAKNLVKGLRSLLRFLYVNGLITTPLSGAVPSVAAWSGGGLPRGVDADSVRRLLAGCDRRSTKGCRDFAILTLLTRLGLRAGEVVALDLDDVDWSRGEVLVHGKAQRLERLPLPADVGEALAGYLSRGRSDGSDRALFCRLLAPPGRLKVSAIGAIVHAACERAGLMPIAPHRLRHTVATELLRRGAGLPEIGQLLRQRSAAVTSIYAKVDTAALRQLARPWPGSAP